MPVIMLILLAITIYGSQTYKKNLRDYSMSVLEVLANRQSDELSGYINAKIREMELLSKLPQVYDASVLEASDFLNKQRELLNFDEFFIITEDAVVYSTTKGLMTTNIIDSDFVKKAMSGETFVSEPFYEGDLPSIDVCSAIENDKGERVGTLCGTLTLDAIQKMIESNQTVLESRCYVLNRKGELLVTADFQNVEEGASIFNYPESDIRVIAESLENREDRSGIMHVEGIDVYVYSKYVKEYDWAVLVSVATKNVKALHRLTTGLQHMFAVFMVIACMGLFRMTRSWRRSDYELLKDSLCDCGSRAACHRMINKMQERLDIPVTVIYCDLNKFKSVNDNFGHDSGDKIIKIFGSACTEVFAPYGFVGRMGGDEFLILLEDLSKERVSDLWDELRTILRERSSNLGFSYEIVSAHGVAVREAGDTTPMKNVVMVAEENMYKEKQKMGVSR